MRWLEKHCVSLRAPFPSQTKLSNSFESISTHFCPLSSDRGGNIGFSNDLSEMRILPPGFRELQRQSLISQNNLFHQYIWDSGNSRHRLPAAKVSTTCFVQHQTSCELLLDVWKANSWKTQRERSLLICFSFLFFFFFALPKSNYAKCTGSARRMLHGGKDDCEKVHKRW